MYSDRERALYKLYEQVRKVREEKSVNSEVIRTVFEKLKTEFPKDWLLPLELYELAVKYELDIQDDLLSYLEQSKENPSLTKLIENGLGLIRKDALQKV